MLKGSHIVFSSLFLLPLCLSACVQPQAASRALVPGFSGAQSGQQSGQSSGPQYTLSRNAELNFAYLQIEQAMQKGDLEAVMSAGETLLRLKGDMRPIGDAAAWLISGKHTAEAERLLKPAIALAPEDAVLRAMFADSLIEQGKPEEAERLMRDYVEQHPDDGQARLDLALLYLKTGANADALRELEKLPKSMQTPAVLYYRAQACRALKRPEQAAQLLELALKQSPDFLEAMLELAGIEEERGNYAKARAYYEKLLNFDEGNQDILIRLVALSLKEGNPERAYELACAMPDSMSFMLAASSLFMDEGRFDLAEKLLSAISEQEGAPEELLFYQAAVTYEGHRDAARTLELLEQISPANRYYDRALKLRAQVLYESGDLERAMEVIRKGREIFPSDKDFAFLSIDLLARQKRYEEAWQTAERALKDWPDDPDLAFQRASFMDLSGRREDALALMEEMLRANPNNASVLNYIGYTLADENRDLPRALELLNRALELSPGTDYMLDSLAWAHYRSGNYAEAWKIIQQAVKKMSASTAQDPTMWEHYGDIAHAYGRNADARRGWERALELRSGNADAIRARLEKLK